MHKIGGSGSQYLRRIKEYGPRYYVCKGGNIQEKRSNGMRRQRQESVA